MKLSYDCHNAQHIPFTLPSYCLHTVHLTAFILPSHNPDITFILQTILPLYSLPITFIMYFTAKLSLLVLEVNLSSVKCETYFSWAWKYFIRLCRRSGPWRTFNSWLFNRYCTRDQVRHHNRYCTRDQVRHHNRYCTRDQVTHHNRYCTRDQVKVISRRSPVLHPTPTYHLAHLQLEGSPLSLFVLSSVSSLHPDEALLPAFLSPFLLQFTSWRTEKRSEGRKGAKSGRTKGEGQSPKKEEVTLCKESERGNRGRDKIGGS